MKDIDLVPIGTWELEQPIPPASTLSLHDTYSMIREEERGRISYNEIINRRNSKYINKEDIKERREALYCDKY